MLRVFEAFTGIGSQRKALMNIGIEHEIVGISEWDINAIVAYNALYEPSFDLSDVSQQEKNAFIVF